MLYCSFTSDSHTPAYLLVVGSPSHMITTRFIITIESRDVIRLPKISVGLDEQRLEVGGLTNNLYTTMYCIDSVSFFFFSLNFYIPRFMEDKVYSVE